MLFGFFFFSTPYLAFDVCLTFTNFFSLKEFLN